jgi:uncharacterized protein (DUF2062 family)
MRKFFRRFLPDHDALIRQRWLKPFGGLLRRPGLWHLNRRSVAGGLATGLFCGLVPGPLQMISAAALAILLRVNLPVAAFTTLYTNPITIIPLYALAYQLGSWVSGEEGEEAVKPLSIPELTWHDGLNQFWIWLSSLGKPILLGLPLLGGLLAIFGYLLVRCLWRLAVISKWQARSRNRRIEH